MILQKHKAASRTGVEFNCMEACKTLASWAYLGGFRGSRMNPFLLYKPKMH